MQDTWIFQNREHAHNLTNAALALITIGDNWPDLLQHSNVGLIQLRRINTAIDNPEHLHTRPLRARELVCFGLAPVPLNANPTTGRDWAALAVRDAFMAAAALGRYQTPHGTSETETFDTTRRILERGISYANAAHEADHTTQHATMLAALQQLGFDTNNVATMALVI